LKEKISLVVFCLLYVLAGLNHFVHSAFYLKLMPAYFPIPLQLVYISGLVECLVGILIIFQKTRLVAAWLTIFLLFVFLTVHVQMIISQYHEFALLFWIYVFRLLLQFFLMRWAYVLGHTLFKKTTN
jgi:uncharacterized membrane protein